MRAFHSLYHLKSHFHMKGSIPRFVWGKKWDKLSLGGFHSLSYTNNFAWLKNNELSQAQSSTPRIMPQIHTQSWSSGVFPSLPQHRSPPNSCFGKLPHSHLYGIWSLVIRLAESSPHVHSLAMGDTRKACVTFSACKVLNGLVRKLSPVPK